ncbi:MAG: ceramidase [Bacteroidetes bacterium]|nr:ceramidase [Bacteroidota bacterium]MBU1580227.1 ceramidase [Bacteroidota bacterium]MBU2465005.1 ceramidase [Bacteroidota bacterium]MBU2559187.1 ceramidase [Bacteroidota bacterium]
MISGIDFLSVAQEWVNQRLADGGPRYAEYHPEQLIVEPWNALSSVAMMLPAIYWFVKNSNNQSSNGFLYFAIAMVFLGGLGSTLFHAFRMSSVFLLLDVLPSALLTLALAIYFWLKILPKWWYVLLILVPVFVIRIFLFNQLSDHLAINLSYAFSGLLVIVPLAILLIKTAYVGIVAVVLVLLSFSIALLFRQLDIHQFDFLPQGTHFLWHFFSAIGSFSMLWYLYILNQVDSQKKSRTNDPA